MQVDIQTKQGHGIEFDEDVVCEVCRQVGYLCSNFHQLVISTPYIHLPVV